LVGYFIVLTEKEKGEMGTKGGLSSPKRMTSAARGERRRREQKNTRKTEAKVRTRGFLKNQDKNNPRIQQLFLGEVTPRTGGKIVKPNAICRI